MYGGEQQQQHQCVIPLLPPFLTRHTPHQPTNNTPPPPLSHTQTVRGLYTLWCLGRPDALAAERAAVSVASLLGEEADGNDEPPQSLQWECIAHTDFSADAVLLDAPGGEPCRVAVLNDALAYFPPTTGDANPERQLAERRLVGRLGRVLYELFTGRAYRPPSPGAVPSSSQGQGQGEEDGGASVSSGSGSGSEGEEEEEEGEDEGYLRELPELGDLVFAFLSQQQQPSSSPPPFYPLRKALRALARVAQRRCAKVAVERVERGGAGGGPQGK